MMTHTAILTLRKNFLGNSPDWYKTTIVAFLLINFVLLYTAGPFVAGWALICEFIFTLAMALKCYPLPTGGLLAIEGVVLGITSPETIYREALNNFEVILLLVFMVAGIYFMKDFLQFAFTRIVINVRSKKTISLLFISTGAILSAFLDALTVTAVIIAVAYGFYNVYHRYASGKSMTCDHDLCCDDSVAERNREELRAFRGFLRNLMMHGAVGTALGGVCTLVGEPQNLLIGAEMGWHFTPFFLKVAPVSMPVLIAGLLTCLLLEKYGLFGYGEKMPESIRSHLIETALEMEARQGVRGKMKVIVQALIGVWLGTALAMHLAAVGIIGLSVIILLTSLNGVTDEHQLGAAFKEALPFTALLIVFFAIVAVIHDQHLFAPVLDLVLSVDGKHQLAAYYSANGLLSMISDNVFVATVYISETKIHFEKMLGAVPDLGMNAQVLMQRLTEANTSRSEVLAAFPGNVADSVTLLMNRFDKIAVAINTGTNIPSVATPNGQAAFLFLLTSGLAPVIRLSYLRMVLMALPYTVTMSATGFFAVYYFL